MSQPGFQPRILPPPTSGNPALDQWLRQLASAFNNVPRLSWFSGTSPNASAVTGAVGDLAVNLASGSTNTRLWQMTGTLSSATTGWKPLMVANIV